MGRWKTPDYRNIKNFRWDVVPLPHEKGVGVGDRDGGLDDVGNHESTRRKRLS